MVNDRPLKFSEYRDFIKLLNEAGYILDFTNSQFSEFTKEITGTDLLKKYELSKGKSLEAFLKEAPRKSSIPLLKALMNEWERTRNSDADDERIVLFSACRKRLEELELSLADIGVGDRLKETGFTSEYLEQQKKLLLEKVSSHPTASIGIAKELIESCCKTILENRNTEYLKSDDVSKLVDKTQRALAINPREVDGSIPDAKAIKALLGSLASVAQHLAELRNIYGTGHGKPISFRGLTERHARLAAGAALSLVTYLWETHCSREPRSYL